MDATAIASADGVRRAPRHISAGSPSRHRAASARGVASAPSTPTGGARMPSARFLSKPSGARPVAPPRRMSTRLQLTLRERLHSRRRLSGQPTPGEEEEDDDEKDADPEVDPDDSESSEDPATLDSSSPEGGARGARSRADTSARRRERRRRRWLLAALQALQTWYYLLCVPLRLGLFFDPFFTAARSGWTRALTVFITLDAIADVAGVALLLWNRRHELRVMRRHTAEAAAHADADGSLKDPSLTPVGGLPFRWTDVLDMVAYFPVEIVLLTVGEYNALHVARLTKLLPLRSLPFAFRDFVVSTRAAKLVPLGFLRHVLGRFLVVVVVIGAVWVHWSALLYILIAHVECGIDLARSSTCASWAVDDQLRSVAAGGGGGSNFRIYSRAMYWASRTIITLGFSDVVANASRSTETFFTIVAEFAGAFWCACVIAGFAYWFTLQHRRGSKYSHDMFVHRVEHLLGRPHFGHSGAASDSPLGSVVPSFLREQITGYLRHEYKQSRVFGEAQCRAIVRQEQLRQGLTCELKTTKLLRLPCFSRQSLGFLNALAGEMKIVSLAPLDWIIEYPGTQSVFFVVVSGTIAVVSPSQNGQKIYTCNAGNAFGAITLFNPSELKEQAFAEDYAEVLVLNADGLDRVLATYYHGRESTATEQRDEMHKAAHEDYVAFKERCNRRHDLQQLMSPLPESSASAHRISHWDTLLAAIELAPRQWQNAQSAFRLNWEAVRCIALLYLTFEVPYIVIFYYGGTRTSYFGDGWEFATTFACSALVEIFFNLDLYLRCNSFQPRKNMKSRTFYLDAIANLPLALIVDIYDGCTHGPLPHGWRWLSLLRLLRLLRVRRLKKRIVATLPRATGVAQFIVYCAISMLVYCHAVACIWFIAGHFSLPGYDSLSLSSLPAKSDCLRMAQQYGNCTWTLMDGMESKFETGNHRFVYLRAMYFSVSTFTTVAYGDILPYNVAETWIAGIATFIGGILCYVMFGAMGAAIARLARRRRETRYENHLRARVLELNRVSRRVRSEINRFQTFRAKTLADYELEQEILAYVTTGLRRQLSRCLHGAAARRFEFSQDASPSFVDAVAARMTRRYYFAGDTMFSAGIVASEVMVIRRGRVQLIDGDTQLVVAVVADGVVLGERSFVTQTEPPLVDYIAETVTEVSVLSREALEELWVHFPNEMRQMTTGDDNASNHGADKRLPMPSAHVNDGSQALGRILIRQDSRGRVGGAEFEQRIKWQRAINGNTFRSRWEVVVGIVVVYNTFSIVARVAFLPSPSEASMVGLTTVDYLFDVLLLIDIYLKSFHFLPPGDMLSVSFKIFEPKHIRTFYYRDGWMLYDVLASLPLYYIGSNYSTMTYCRIPRLLRALQLVDIGERVHSGLLQRWTASTSSAGVAYSLLGLSKVMVVLCLCCHIGGSVFYATASHESKQSDRTPWIRGDVVINQHTGDLWVAYLRSFYWAISTVTVVNYGDIVATTVRETLWACVICLLGTFFMSKVISDLVDLLQSLDQCASEHRERVELFEYVALRRELPEELTERGQVFLNYEYEVSYRLPPPEEVFCMLPRELQTRVYDEMYGSILRRVPLFESLSDQQIRELAAAPWHTKLFLPDDVIVYENSLADSLFVMKCGRAEVLRFASGLSITQVESGQLFGEAMFFSSENDEKTGVDGPRRMVSVRALSFCEVLRLDRAAWLRFMAVRASNREAGRRVLEIAQGEQLKSRALLQKIESNLDVDDSEHSRSSSSRSSQSSEQRDRFDSKAQPMFSNALATEQRDAPTRNGNTAIPTAMDAPRAVRRIGSTPALLFSQMVRRLSFSRGDRRTSDAYVAVATPTMPDATRSPSNANHTISNVNVLRRFESLPATPEADINGPNIQVSTASEPMRQQPVSRFVDSSVFCYRWDVIKFFAILYYVAALPLRVSFYDDIERAAQESTGNGDRVMKTWIVCEYVFVDGFLWLDILMRLFVFVPTVRGEPLQSRRECRQWYMRHGSFAIDLLGSFPLELLSLLPVDAFRDGTDRGAVVAAGFRLTTLIRCFQLEPLWWRLERQLFWFQKDTLTTLKIAFIGVLSSHWIACLWYFVGNAAMDSNPLSWLTAPGMLALDPTGMGSPLTPQDVEQVSMLNKYLRSYHFAIGSISTTTYGDIVSRNVAETLAQLVVTFLCLVFYGYVTSGVRQILSRKFSRTIALEQDEDKIDRFVAHFGLSRSLASSIRLHLRERWRQESDVDQKVVAQLVHGPLRREIAAYLRSPLFETEEPRRLAFEDLPDVVVKTLLAELREEAYVENEVIYEQYAVGHVMYFVESGLVQLSSVGRDQQTSVKRQGEFFGESCVVGRATSERRETAVAQTNCRLAVLDADALERVLAQFPTHAAAIRDAWSPHASV